MALLLDSWLEYYSQWYCCYVDDLVCDCKPKFVFGETRFALEDCKPHSHYCNSNMTIYRESGIYPVLLPRPIYNVFSSISLSHCSSDEYTTRLILQCSQKFIQLCGLMSMTVPRDAFLTALCKSCLPPRFTLSLITSHRTTRSSSSAAAMTQETSEKKGGSEGDPVIIRGGSEGAAGGSRKKLAFSQSGEGVVSGGSVGGGGEGGGGKATTPVLGQKWMQSALVSMDFDFTSSFLSYFSCKGEQINRLKSIFKSPSPK